MSQTTDAGSTTWPYGHRATIDRPRNEMLDVVRIVAALGVLAFHARLRLGLDFGPLDSIIASLDLGVLAFFSLSGFLVYLPFARGPVSTGEHLTRRLLRIVPAYCIAVLGTAALVHLDPMLGGVTWTLVVEVTFYAALPILVMAMTRLGGERQGRQLVVLIVLAAGSFGARLAALGEDGYSWEVTGRIPFLWLWAFLPGMLIAAVVAWRTDLTERLARWPVLGTAVALIALTLVVPTDTLGPIQIGRMVLMAVATALLIPGSLRMAHRAWLGPIAASGRTLSYPLYLWHTTVLLLAVAAGLTGWFALGLSVVVVLLVSYASWVAIERPVITYSSSLVARMRARTDHSTAQAPSLVTASEEPAPVPVTAD
jgi:peptidoglycan/LPS O-acetylase OafA/YrhL